MISATVCLNERKYKHRYRIENCKKRSCKIWKQWLMKFYFLEHLKQDLEDYVTTLPVPTYVYRTEKRSGLIRARLLGAKHVKGQVITFLDAHCECTEGWLEPLLSRIANDRHTVVCPIIDVISDDTFEYIPASDMTWGGFNWKLNFRWYYKL